jgi:hypothetical protein
MSLSKSYSSSFLARASKITSQQFLISQTHILDLTIERPLKVHIDNLIYMISLTDPKKHFEIAALCNTIMRLLTPHGVTQKEIALCVPFSRAKLSKYLVINHAPQYIRELNTIHNVHDLSTLYNLTICSSMEPSYTQQIVSILKIRPNKRKAAKYLLAQIKNEAKNNSIKFDDCPWCKTPVEYKQKWMIELLDDWEVYCKNPKCCVKPKLSSDITYRTKREAADAWNITHKKLS